MSRLFWYWAFLTISSLAGNASSSVIKHQGILQNNHKYIPESEIIFKNETLTVSFEVNTEPGVKQQNSTPGETALNQEVNTINSKTNNEAENQQTPSNIEAINNNPSPNQNHESDDKKMPLAKKIYKITPQLINKPPITTTTIETITLKITLPATVSTESNKQRETKINRIAESQIGNLNRIIKQENIDAIQSKLLNMMDPKTNSVNRELKPSETIFKQTVDKSSSPVSITNVPISLKQNTKSKEQNRVLNFRLGKKLEPMFTRILRIIPTETIPFLREIPTTLYSTLSNGEKPNLNQVALEGSQVGPVKIYDKFGKSIKWTSKVEPMFTNHLRNNGIKTVSNIGQTKLKENIQDLGESTNTLIEPTHSTNSELSIISTALPEKLVQESKESRAINKDDTATQVVSGSIKDTVRVEPMFTDRLTQSIVSLTPPNHDILDQTILPFSSLTTNNDVNSIKPTLTKKVIQETQRDKVKDAQSDISQQVEIHIPVKVTPPDNDNQNSSSKTLEVKLENAPQDLNQIKPLEIQEDGFVRATKLNEENQTGKPSNDKPMPMKQAVTGSNIPTPKKIILAENSFPDRNSDINIISNTNSLQKVLPKVLTTPEEPFTTSIQIDAPKPQTNVINKLKDSLATPKAITSKNNKEQNLTNEDINNLFTSIISNLKNTTIPLHTSIKEIKGFLKHINKPNATLNLPYLNTQATQDISSSFPDMEKNKPEEIRKPDIKDITTELIQTTKANTYQNETNETNNENTEDQTIESQFVANLNTLLKHNKIAFKNFYNQTQAPSTSPPEPITEKEAEVDEVKPDNKEPNTKKKNQIEKPTLAALVPLNMKANTRKAIQVQEPTLAALVPLTVDPNTEQKIKANEPTLAALVPLKMPETTKRTTQVKETTTSTPAVPLNIEPETKPKTKTKVTSRTKTRKTKTRKPTPTTQPRRSEDIEKLMIRQMEAFINPKTISDRKISQQKQFSNHHSPRVSNQGQFQRVPERFRGFIFPGDPTEVGRF